MTLNTIPQIVQAIRDLQTKVKELESKKAEPVVEKIAPTVEAEPVRRPGRPRKEATE
jgi:hypothetical protein